MIDHHTNADLVKVEGDRALEIIQKYLEVWHGKFERVQNGPWSPIPNSKSPTIEDFVLSNNPKQNTFHNRNLLSENYSKI